MRRPSFAALAVFLATTNATAANGFDSPEAGVVQVARGGAWLVRADDPLAGYFNPAALVKQRSGVHLGAHLMIRQHCYDRLDQSGQRPAPAPGFDPAPGEVCAEVRPFPNPQIAASLRLHRDFAIGLAVVGPHAAGGETWPETIEYAGRFGVAHNPSPQRYMITKSDGVFIWPTLALAYAVTPRFSVGAGFVWGVVHIDYTNTNEAVSFARAEPQPDDFSIDARARISGTDGFVPGFVASARWAPSDRVEVAGWYRFSDEVRTSVDLTIDVPFYSASGVVAPLSAETTNHVEDAGHTAFSVPMEARFGVRYRHPRGARGDSDDPFVSDLFDIELNFSWANNSSFDVAEVRFTDAGGGRSNIPIKGTPGYVPHNADVPHRWKDVMGVRLGGDVNVLPGKLAVRAGGFFEGKGVDDQNLLLDFHPAQRFGLAVGATYRLASFDLSIAYQHTFFGTLDNGGRGAIKALSGAGTDDYRSRQAVNGGSSTASMDEIALGATYRFGGIR